jgi:hypothetical protein
VSVQVDQNGFGRQGFEVTTFRAPVSPPPKAPRRLSITRRGDVVHMSWRASGAGVAGYTVQVATTGGAKLIVTVTRPSLVLRGIVLADTVAAQVTAFDVSGQRSAPAVRSLAGKAASACRAPGTSPSSFTATEG